MQEAAIGGTSSRLWAATVLTDGSPVVAGYETTEDGDCDFVAFKLDPIHGTTLWKWKNGSKEDDVFFGAAAGPDGSVTLVGFTRGDWDQESSELRDTAVLKLDANGTELWRWQNGTSEHDLFYSVVVTDDGSAIIGGTVGKNFSIVKIDENGNMLWEWKEHTGEDDRVRAVALATDGSIIAVGYTFGSWARPNAGDRDFIAAKLFPNGTKSWRWQNGTDGFDDLESLVVFEDGSVLCGGSTSGSFGRTIAGDADWVIVKLDADGTESWRRQDGTSGSDRLTGMAMDTDGKVILGGHTTGNWSGTSKGGEDVVATKIDVGDRDTDIWRWQNGTVQNDSAHAMAVVPEGVMIFAGRSSGSFGDQEGTQEEQSSGAEEAAAFMLQTIAPAPSAPPTFSPSSAPVSFMPPMRTAPTVPPSSSDAPGGPRDQIIGLEAVALAAAAAGGLVVVGVIVYCLRRKCPRRLSETPEESESKGGAGPAPADDLDGGDQGAVRGGDIEEVPKIPWGAGELVARAGTSESPEEKGPVTLTENGHLIEKGQGSSTISLEEKSATRPGHSLVLPLDPGALASEFGVSRESKGGSSYRLGEEDIVIAKHPHVLSGHAAAAAAAAAAPARRLAGTTARVEAPGPLPPIVPEREAGAERSGGASESPIVEAKAASSAEDIDEDDHRDKEELTASTAMASTAEKPSGIGTDDRTLRNSRVISSGHGWADRDRGEASNLGIRQAVLEAAEKIAASSGIPGVSEAASLLSVLAHLVVDGASSTNAAIWKLRWCRSIMSMLERASYIFGEGKGHCDKDQRVLLEDVRDSIEELVGVIKTYNSKSRLSQVITSSLFKRRQEEAEAVINMVIARLHIGLQVHNGHHLSVVRQDVKESLEIQRRLSLESNESNTNSEGLVEARRQRRERRLYQLEIPEDHLVLTDELLGKGGFGSVYLADYNGRNAAAKVIDLEREDKGSGARGEWDEGQSPNNMPKGERQRKAFMRELEAMTRLRSPYTVNVYGVVTSRRDKLILVMELLAGGDMRTFLKNAAEPIPEGRVRQIIGDIGAGMAFLHSKETIHGDLKSVNVLFDGFGKAKVADFGTTRWIQHTVSTGLATYTTQRPLCTHMSFPWTAPEVLDNGISSYKSDVYSFGMVLWEILTRGIPWSTEPSIQQIARRVLIKNERPEIPPETPDDLVDILRGCWDQDPEKRPSANAIMMSVKSFGWKEA